HRARFADRRLECPDAHVGNPVLTQPESLTFDDPVLGRHLESQPAGDRVERRRITPLRRQALERVGARFDLVEVRTLERYGDQDVTDLQRVAFDLIDAYDVVPELCRPRGRHLAGLQAPHGLHEGSDEGGVVPFDPADIPAALPAAGVARLALRDVLELRPAGELAANARDVGTRRGAVLGTRQARDRNEPYVRDGRPLEVVGML